MGVGGDGTKFYSLEEVSEHNKGRGEDKSIWMVIHDKVYDVTKFLDEVKPKVIVHVQRELFPCLNTLRRLPKIHGSLIILSFL